MTQTYTHLHMEAATCLWEAMLEYREQHQPFGAFFADCGTVELRHMAINLSDFMLKVWDAMTEEEQERVIPYDWEFTPRFLAALEWDHVNQLAEHPENPREMADLILASL